MTAYVVLLRAANVGGTGKLPMSDLKSMCEDEGFEQVKTYIASGNVVFVSDKTAREVQTCMEERLEKYAGKPVGIIVRTAEEMSKVLAENPFPEAAPNRTMTIFLKETTPDNTLQKVCGLTDEEIEPGRREIYVHYPNGISNSKLVIPAAKSGTSRNMNSVAKITELAAVLKV